MRDHENVDTRTHLPMLEKCLDCEAALEGIAAYTAVEEHGNHMRAVSPLCRGCFEDRATKTQTA